MKKKQSIKCRACAKREAGNDGLCNHCRYMRTIAIPIPIGKII